MSADPVVDKETDNSPQSKVNRQFFVDRMRQIGVSQNEFGKRLDLDPSQISRVFHGKRRMTAEEIGRTADILEITTETVLKNLGIKRVGPASPPQRKVDDGFSPKPANVNLIKTRYLPVYGCAAGCSVMEDGAFEFNGQVIEFIPAPPSLAEVKNAYSVIVAGDSMVPAFHPGQLAIVNPTKRIEPGRGVILQVASRQLADPPLAYIKEFVRANGTEIVCKQYNPAKEIVFDRRMVLSAHRVVGVWDE